MKPLVCIAISFALVASPLGARAQETTDLLEGQHHSVAIEAGLDSGMTLGVGYAYRWQTGFWEHPFLLVGRLTVPAAGFDLADSSVEAGVRTTVVAYGNLRLQAALGPVLRNTHNVLFSANAIGVRAELLPGYQSSRWGLMADLGYERMLVTHLRHSDLYEETFYADAESGWYGTTAGTWRLGIRGGVRIADVHLTARLGFMTSQEGEPHLPPFYAAIGTGYAF